MILSFSNNFIFLRTRKTAGTSAELVLSSWCADDDICTPLHPHDEASRGTLGGLPARKYYHGRRVYNHMGAALVAQRVPKFWQSSFRFVVERHPYEKVVSRAFWNVARRGGCFEDEVAFVLRGKSFLDRHIYMIDGKIAVDEVVRYDQLWQWMRGFARRLGKPMPAQLPMLKADHRADMRPAHDILSDAQKAQVQAVADFEFQRFGFAR